MKHWKLFVLIGIVLLILYWLYNKISGAISGAAQTVANIGKDAANVVEQPYKNYSSYVDGLFNNQSQDIITSPALPLPGESDANPSTSLWFGF